MEQLPMYERQGSSGYQGGIEKTLFMLNKFDKPHLKIPMIHIAGTNGKGSVSSLIASILQEAGYKVGLYTSPHLKTMRERIKVNGEMIPAQWIAKFTTKNFKLLEQLKPSFFEINTVMAFSYFAQSNVDIAVIETGLGGRLDATNVIIPLVSIITNISYDHTNLLGNTLQEIAAEKAGIIKNGIPCIIGENDQETLPVFIDFAYKNNARLIISADEWKLIDFSQNLLPPSMRLHLKNNYNDDFFDIYSPLIGKFQIDNIKTVLSAINILQTYKYIISTKHIINGIKNVFDNTGFFGRWTYVPDRIPIIMDIGHNVNAVSNVIKILESIPKDHLHIVWGMMADKDIDGILSLLPKDAIYYFCSPKVPRALDFMLLNEKAKNFNLSGKTYNSVSNALNAAKSQAIANDIIYVGGSAFVVAEAM